MRRSALVIAASAAACLVTALSGVAAAAPAAGGIKGSPQPGLKPFNIGSSNYAGGGVALEPNGTLVVVRGTTAGDGKAVVCVLARGAAKCASSVTLSPLGAVDMFGVPQVFISSANHVVVLMDTCCDDNPAGGDLLFSSVNGGKSFGKPVRVGGIGVSTAALVGKNIVFTSGDDHDGSEVESIPVNAAGPPATTAIANPQVAYDAGVGSYKGGALVGADVLGKDYATYVEYAPAGKNFDASASYGRVGSFNHEQLMGISGNALLTVQTAGKELLLLRLFNGKSFGPAHAVPGLANTGPSWFTMDQDPSGAVHVFSVRASAPVSYDLYEVSTETGASWSGSTNLGDAIGENNFDVGLDATGAGLVLGTHGEAVGFPVLAAQSASFGLKAAAIKKGKATTAVGVAKPAAPGRQVELQVEKAGLWYTVATTHEGAGGKFGFTIKGTAAGTFAYRAVVVDWAGYRLYGYSAARALKVVG